MKKRRGQILILVLLVVVVALAVGLSVASRNITNLRTSTQTEQSQRAFSAAEGGVEDVLSRLSTVASSIPVGDQTTVLVDVGGIIANVNVKSSNVYEATIDEGTVGQVDLTGYGGNITVEWIKKGDPSEDVTPKASVELTVVCQSNSCAGVTGTGGYSQYRRAYQAEPISGQDGFSSCSSSIDYVCSALIQNVVAGDNARVLRIRPFWRKATVRVSGSPVLPVQTYDLISTAATELGITRRVQVQRTVLPQLPAAFDYVLFSEGSIVK